uniref:Uncharacterized protein n=1 Tax=Desertifilum tharense IPPAS B-1220 TaxID=1781255 RepID=A0ACD5GRV0_9CYAN
MGKRVGERRELGIRSWGLGKNGNSGLILTDSQASRNSELFSSLSTLESPHLPTLFYSAHCFAEASATALSTQHS